MEENTQNNPFDAAHDKQNLYQCKECGFHYKEKEIAEKCETWCKEHKTCNVEITKQAQENQNDGSNLINGKHISNSSELEICRKKCDEYLNNWKRERADFLNYKKDEMERMTVLMQYGKEAMVEKFLPILDGINLAEKNLFTNSRELVNEKEHVGWKEGFLQIQKQIDEFLKKEGIEEIEVVGKPFDPNTMEIVEEVNRGQIPVESGTVVEELQKGYTMNDKVIRPVKVKVTK